MFVNALMIQELYVVWGNDLLKKTKKNRLSFDILVSELRESPKSNLIFSKIKLTVIWTVMQIQSSNNCDGTVLLKAYDLI